MIYAVKILAILFAVAHIVAVAAAIRKGNHDLNLGIMSAGAAMVAASAAVPKLEWIGALLGGAIVCYAAYMNGKRSGKVNPVHHIVRAAVVVLFTVGYIIW